MTNYTDLLIRIGTWNATSQTYPVEARISDGSFYGGGQFQLDQPQLLAMAANPVAYGNYLFETLFMGAIGRAYERAITLAETQTEGQLRLRLWVETTAAELQAIRWERLQHHYKGTIVPVSISHLTPFSRYIELETAEAPPLTVHPLEMLIAVANPEGLPTAFVPVNVEFEVENIYQALMQVNHSSKVINVTLMPGRTGISPELATKVKQAGWRLLSDCTNLDSLARYTAGCHIVHFIGHGSFRRRTGGHGEGQVVLHLEETETGRWAITNDSDIISRLAGLTPLPYLIFLVACETSKRDNDNGHAFVGLGPKLVQLGVPAVVAMQDLVPIKLAQQLAREFYSHLQTHGIIDSALNHARSLLFDRNSSNTWDVPALFMRSETGRLLSPDPLRVTLNNIYYHKDFYFFCPDSHKYLPLPVDVLHLTANQSLDEVNSVIMEGTATIDIITATLDIFANHHQREQKGGPIQGKRKANARPQPQLLLLLGGYGSNKSTQLRHLVWQTAAASLQANPAYLVLPIYVDLQNYSAMQIGVSNRLEALLFNSLEPFWANLTQTQMDALLADKSGPTLRIFLANSDHLSEQERLTVWQQLLELMQNYPRHEYMADQNSDLFNPHYFNNLQLEVLKIQPLDTRKICYFLENRAPIDPNSLSLFKALHDGQLLDLAAIPWFMVDMMRRAKSGDLPDSRTEVLQRLIDDALIKIPLNGGMRGHAEAVLYELAWRMYNQQSTRWPLTSVFDIMKQMRGNRAYNLEDFYNALLDSGIVAPLDKDNLRFSYAPMQAFCCAKAIVAMPNRDQVLDDLTARFGRFNWLRWGQETVIFMSGLLANKIESLEKLLRTIVYGVDLLASEQTFLAAQVLLEARNERQRLKLETPSDDQEMFNQVLNALIWRLDSQHEPRLAYRLEAATLIGQAATAEAIGHLANVATAPVRLDLRQLQDYDFGSMRIVAMTALQRIISNDPEQIPKLPPTLAEILQLRLEKKVNRLIEYLHLEDKSLRSAAALILGDLQPQLQAMPDHQLEAALIMEHLVDAFFDPNTDEVTLWAVAHALAMLDTMMITQEVIVRALALRETEANLQRDKCLAYLIGRIRSQERGAHTFLVEHCIKKCDDMRLWATAIEALGWLAHPKDKTLLETVACGQLEKVNPQYSFFKEYQLYLQGRAIEALSHVGDADSLTKLQAAKVNWIADLRRVFYRTSEEIYWRLTQNKE